ncbi:hypothetical protein LOK46_14405 [Methylobacterium sp. NMS14P]|uniref:hypothetical protein n=1 Tax=Methylobacterium sp. NMS14P TaxID=2894310 RepID=UPI002358248F|nr:hypothetical protein [Methylobacterium sp. NMS14P]WCS27964.1 hypothetical protein LOK46_14405 [Methylobacterium sp. NMS14P]
MSTAAICVIAVCALLAFVTAAGVVMSFVESLLVSKAQPPCPCRDIHSITVGAPTVTEFSADSGPEVATEHCRIVVAAGKVH